MLKKLKPTPPPKKKYDNHLLISGSEKLSYIIYLNNSVLVWNKKMGRKQMHQTLFF